MKTIFQIPIRFCRKTDSNHFWFVVPELSVMLPLLGVQLGSIVRSECRKQRVHCVYDLPAVGGESLWGLQSRPVCRTDEGQDNVGERDDWGPHGVPSGSRTHDTAIPSVFPTFTVSLAQWLRRWLVG